MTWEGPHPGVGRGGEEHLADRLAGTDLKPALRFPLTPY